MVQHTGENNVEIAEKTLKISDYGHVSYRRNSRLKSESLCDVVLIYIYCCATVQVVMLI